MTRPQYWVIAVIGVLFFAYSADAVQRTRFRTCQDSPFCSRIRTYALDGKSYPWHAKPEELRATLWPSGIHLPLHNAEYPTQPPLRLLVSLLPSGVARVQVKENEDIVDHYGERWTAVEILNAERFSAPSTVDFTLPLNEFTRSLANSQRVAFSDDAPSMCTTMDSGHRSCLKLSLNPLRISLSLDGVIVAHINEDALLHMEQRHAFSAVASSSFPADNPYAYTFDKHKDTNPYGPAAFSVDVSFPLHEHVYGLPEHVSTYALKRTRAPRKDTAFPPSAHSSTPVADARTARGERMPLPSRLQQHAATLRNITSLVTDLVKDPHHPENRVFPNENGQWGMLSYDEPYRLFNADVFEYEVDEPMALYGNAPFVHTHTQHVRVVRPAAAGEGERVMSVAVGALLLTAADTFVDVYSTHPRAEAHARDATYAFAQEERAAVATHWMVETGDVDVFLFAGASPAAVRALYAQLSGMPALPPRWALGAHQSRWNYMSAKETLEVDALMDKHDLPYDTVWLDIEHTDGKRYFTWNTKSFSDPLAMQEQLRAKGRHLVTIVDPHVKRDDEYAVYAQALAQGLLVRVPGGAPYHGHCWPGESAYPDFTRADVRSYWADWYLPDKYPHAGSNLHIWNDMNEPSVFDGPEGSMQRDSWHCAQHVDTRAGTHQVTGPANATALLPPAGCVEHRALHNTFGYFYHLATEQGMLHRQRALAEAHRTGSAVSPFAFVPSERPFVLTRAFYTGTQARAAIWTGDNSASWSHLRSATPMLLSLSAASLANVGTDIGGFFGKVSGELLLRWYQAALLHPFHRNHAHIDAPRREPWMFPKMLPAIRQSLRMRYQLLQHLYTHMRIANITGSAPMHALADVFPEDPSARVEDAVYLVGGLLVVPVTKKDANEAVMYAPVASPDAPAHAWLDWYTGQTHTAGEDSATLVLPAPLERSPLLLVPGVSVWHQEHVRRSSFATAPSPYTLTLAQRARAVQLPTHALTAVGLQHVLSSPTSVPVLAHGHLYVDDGGSYQFLRGGYLHAHALSLVPSDTLAHAFPTLSSVTLITRAQGPSLWSSLPSTCLGGGLATDMCARALDFAIATSASQVVDPAAAPTPADITATITTNGDTSAAEVAPAVSVATLRLLREEGTRDNGGEVRKRVILARRDSPVTIAWCERVLKHAKGFDDTTTMVIGDEEVHVAFSDLLVDIAMQAVDNDAGVLGKVLRGRVVGDLHVGDEACIGIIA